MYALLGNFEGKVKAGNPEFVFARINVYKGMPPSLPTMEVILVKNEGVVPNIYNLLVKIWDGNVVGLYDYGV